MSIRSWRPQAMGLISNFLAAVPAASPSPFMGLPFMGLQSTVLPGALRGVVLYRRGRRLEAGEPVPNWPLHAIVSPKILRGTTRGNISRWR